jgi:hypothetical protein
MPMLIDRIRTRSDEGTRPIARSHIGRNALGAGYVLGVELPRAITERKIDARHQSAR